MKLARREQTAQVRVCRDRIRRLRELTRQIKQLERELAPLVAEHGAPLLEIAGCGLVTAARLLAEIGHIDRFTHRRAAGHLRRRRPAGRLLGQATPAPAQPHRQPPAQQRPARHRAHPGPHPPRRPRLHRPAPLGRQDQRRSHPRAQAPPRPRDLPRLQGHAGGRAHPGPDDHTHHLIDIGETRWVPRRRPPAGPDPAARTARASGDRNGQGGNYGRSDAIARASTQQSRWAGALRAFWRAARPPPM